MTSPNTPERHRHISASAGLDVTRLTLHRPPSRPILLAALALALSSSTAAFVAAETVGLSPRQPAVTAPKPGGGLGPDAAAAIDIAVTQATLLAGLSADNAATNIAQLRAAAAGRWAEQLAADPQGLAHELRAANVTATPDIRDAAIADITISSAVVLIAGYATVSSPTADNDAVRALNLRVTLTRGAESADDNTVQRWAVTGVEVIA